VSKPFSLDELVEIFWQSDAAEVLAHQWSIARVYARRSVSLFSITSIHEEAVGRSCPT
jgi:hypothetical protein